MAHGGGAIGRYTSGGTVCCVTYPRVWTPALKVKVEWKRSDCEGQRHLCTIETAEKRTYPYKLLEKTIPIPEFTKPGEVYVLFFPHDEVQVHIISQGFMPGTILGNLGYPSHHNPEERNQ